MTWTITEAVLFLSRSVELSILAKATIMLLLGLTAAGLAVQGRASTRNLLLGVTFVTLLALPLVVISIPAVTIELPTSRASGSFADLITMPPSEAASSPTSSSLGRRTEQSSQSSAALWPTMVRFVWIAGAMLLLVPLVVDLWRLRRLRRDGLPWPHLRERVQSLAAECGIRRSVEVLLHEDIPAPLTCGLWRPAIVLSTDARQWSETELRCALVHELEHVRRGDWAIQLVARAVCAFYWFHPLVWLAWRRLCLEAERACDDAVIRSEERTDYAEQLVSLAQRMSKAHAQPALGMANRSDLSTRVSALLDNSQRRGRAGLLAVASAMGGAGLVVLAIAPVHAVAQSTATQESHSSANGNQTPRSTPLDRALYEAAANGDISDIDRLLNAGANVNAALAGDGSPLIGAARKGRLAIVRLLLDRGADPNMSVPGDGNPLIMAAREGHTDVVTLLLDRGAPIEEVVPGDENALIQASGSGHLNVVELLVSRRADVNARVWALERGSDRNGEWRTPLSMARKGGHGTVVAFLLSAGARE